MTQTDVIAGAILVSFIVFITVHQSTVAVGVPTGKSLGGQLAAGAAGGSDLSKWLSLMGL